PGMPSRDRTRASLPAGAPTRAIAPPTMDDPYRTSQQVGTCPRCENATESDGDRLVCVRGCGEWYPRARLDEVLGWDDLNKPPGGIGLDGRRAAVSSWPWGAALCPICRRE